MSDTHSEIVVSSNPRAKLPQTSLVESFRRPAVESLEDTLMRSASYKRLRRLSIVAMVSCLALVATLVTLTAVIRVSGAVIGQGALVVETSSKKLQHPTGGVVGAIYVKEGDRVKAGQVLIRLDETVARANMVVMRNTLDQQRAKAARLAAELSGAEIAFPPEMIVRAKTEADLAELLEGERRLYAVRASTRQGERNQLKERIAQAQQEIAGYTAQEAAKRRELVFIGRELEGVRDLYAKKLVSIQRVNALERDATRLEGDRGQLLSAIAKTKGLIAETELQTLQIDQKMRSDAASELRDAQAKIAESSEKLVAAEDTLKRIDIRAPLDGVVNQFVVHTVGGVVAPNELIGYIVPERDKLVAEVRVRPQDVEQIYPGQHASLVFSALDRSVTPTISGVVELIGADAVMDQKTGASYFVARVGYSDDEAARLGQDVRLSPGMPVESFITTQSRTVMSYVLKPLFDQFNRAFRS